MSVERSRSVAWDGKVLTGWVTVGGIPTKVIADRDFIHRHTGGFNDAVTWEIERHRVEIFEKLVPQLIKSEQEGRLLALGVSFQQAGEES